MIYPYHDIIFCDLRLKKPLALPRSGYISYMRKCRMINSAMEWHVDNFHSIIYIFQYSTHTRKIKENTISKKN